jgi:hypothetical protein
MKKDIITIGNGRIVAVLFLISALLFSCKGEKGDNGTDGMLATKSAIFDSNPGNWSGDSTGYTTTLNMAEITSDIFDKGAVLVYVLVEDQLPKSFNLLPYTSVNGSSIRYMDFDAYIGKIIITKCEVVNGKNVSQAPLKPTAFKVVVIRGIAFANLKQQVNIQDYNAVTKFLGPDKNYNRN